MAKLEWNLTGERLFETGVSQGVLFVMGTGGAYEAGVAWNGLSSVSESPEGGEPNDIYADDIKYLTLMSAENFKGSISAYMYPDEWEACDGMTSVVEGVTIGLQARRTFGLAYITKVGNDVEGNAYGEKLHLVYGCLASPSERAYNTVNDSPEAINFSWDFSSTPIAVTGHRPTSSVVIDSTKVGPAKFALIKSIIQGDYTGGGSYAVTIPNTPYLPTPDEIIELLGAPVATKETVIVKEK